MTRHDQYDARKRQILEGALAAFAELGYAGASNKQIAEAAGLNSTALLYHYFDNKQALFEAVIEEFMPAPRLAMRPDELLKLPVEDVLRQMASAIMGALEDARTNALLRTMLSEALHDTQSTNVFFQGGSDKILSFLYRYFEGLMTRGIIKQENVGAVVRCFVGPLVAHIISDYFVQLPDSQAPSTAIMIDTTITIFLKGMDYQANS
ncbi:MAG: TetR/AcrR family transcriptional regulator [Anaerolineae bacterium]|nr:TetR/AcrR family transcriptional regulator [Anaerolineae bacterium]